MADSDTTKAHLTAVGMTGSDAQAARVLTALAGSTLLNSAHYLRQMSRSCRSIDRYGQ